MRIDSYDDIYATLDGWTPVDGGAAWPACRYSVREVEGGEMYFTEVIFDIPAISIADLVQEFTHPWTWWKYGKCVETARDAGGEIEFLFWPSPTPVVKLACRMRPAELLADGSIRLFCEMSGTADGAYYFDFTSTPEGVRLTSRQLGQHKGFVSLVMSLEKFAETHVLSEIGRFGFPLPKGSGFVGLRKALAERPSESALPTVTVADSLL